MGDRFGPICLRATRGVLWLLNIDVGVPLGGVLCSEQRSVSDTFTTLVKVFQEVALVLVLDFVVVGEALVASIDSLANRCDLVEEDGSPDIAILHVIEAIVASCNEAVNGPRVPHLVMLSPVAGELQLRLLWIAVLAEAIQVD